MCSLFMQGVKGCESKAGSLKPFGLTSSVVDSLRLDLGQPVGPLAMTHSQAPKRAPADGPMSVSGQMLECESEAFFMSERCLRNTTQSTRLCGPCEALLFHVGIIEDQQECCPCVKPCQTHCFLRAMPLRIIRESGTSIVQSGFLLRADTLLGGTQNSHESA